MYNSVLVFSIDPQHIGERDTIKGVQIRAGAVYICVYMFGGGHVTIVAYAIYM